ncbi:hypothetical protein D3C81_1327970 [compost metagenome]
MRKFFSVAFKSLAGMFVYLIALFAFLAERQASGKLTMLAVMAACGAVAMLAGLALSGFAQWRRDTGIVLLAAAAFTAFLVLCAACMFGSDDVMKLMPPGSVDMFDSYLTGAAVLLGIAVLGGCLLRQAGPRVVNPA